MITHSSNMKILFNKRGKAKKPKDIRKSVAAFGESYKRTVQQIIDNSSTGLSPEVFKENVAILMPNFGMTRNGPFRGIKYSDGRIKDPRGQIAACWNKIGKEAVQIRDLIDAKNRSLRARALVEISIKARKEVISEIWKLFKELLPLCMGEHTYGLVGASKVLFAVLPEVALPIDTSMWKTVFKTIDYGEIIENMASEIKEWESEKGKGLELCDPNSVTTLPTVYNVMAMKARRRS